MLPLIITSTYHDARPEREAELASVREVLKNGEKWEWIDLPSQNRRSFADLAQKAKGTDSERVVMVCNSDCFPSPDHKSWNWEGLKKRLLHRTQKKPNFFCLSRWDELANGTLKPFLREDSQDAWIWLGELPEPLLERLSDATLGIPGVDNRIAAEAEEAGYWVSNPSWTFKLVHRHASDLRNYVHGTTPPVPPPWRVVHPIP